MRLIDADALMKAMYERAFETDGDTMWQSGCWVRYRAVEQVVKEQPTIEPQQWIPCSERLPTYRETVLLTTLNHYRTVGYLVPADEVGDFDKFINIQDEWCISGWYRSFEDVLAWMPLPEPYEEQAE